MMLADNKMKITGRRFLVILVIIHGIALLASQSAYSQPGNKADSVLPTTCYDNMAQIRNANQKIGELQEAFEEKSQEDATDESLEVIVTNLNAQVKILKEAKAKTAAACE